MTAIGEPEKIVEIPDPIPVPSGPGTTSDPGVPDYVPETWPEKVPEKEPA